MEATFEQAADAFDAILTVTEDMFPTRLAFGVGACLEVPDHAASAYEHASGALVDSLRRDAWATIYGAGVPWDDVWSAGFRLVGEVRARWTTRQLQVIRHLRSGLNQTQAAKRLGVGTGTVSIVLKTARWAAVRDWEALTRNQFQSIDVPGMAPARAGTFPLDVPMEAVVVGPSTP